MRELELAADRFDQISHIARQDNRQKVVISSAARNLSLTARFCFG